MSREPDICTSIMCSSYGCDYCAECSHGLYFGEGEDRNGKLWKWEFNLFYGPVFLRKDGEPLKRQPCDENHPAWAPFKRWFKKHKTTKEVTDE